MVQAGQRAVAGTRAHQCSLAPLLTPDEGMERMEKDSPPDFQIVWSTNGVDNQQPHTCSTDTVVAVKGRPARPIRRA